MSLTEFREWAVDGIAQNLPLPRQQVGDRAVSILGPAPHWRPASTTASGHPGTSDGGHSASSGGDSANRYASVAQGACPSVQKRPAATQADHRRSWFPPRIA